MEITVAVAFLSKCFELLWMCAASVWVVNLTLMYIRQWIYICFDTLTYGMDIGYGEASAKHMMIFHVSLFLSMFGFLGSLFPMKMFILSLVYIAL